MAHDVPAEPEPRQPAAFAPPAGAQHSTGPHERSVSAGTLEGLIASNVLHFGGHQIEATKSCH